MVETAVALAVLLYFLFSALVVLQEDERVLVLRLGRPIGVRGPGIVMLVPLFDRGIRVKLPEAVPGWQTLSEEELARRVETFVLGPRTE